MTVKKTQQNLSTTLESTEKNLGGLECSLDNNVGTNTELPEGWIATNLENVILKIVGGGTPSKTNSSFFEGVIPWMTVKDMNKHILEDTVDHISQEAVDSSATNIIPAGTPIVATRMSLGKIVVANFDSAINQDLKALFSSKQIDTVFLVYWYRSQAREVERLGTGTTVKGVRLEVLRALDFPLPPLAEQTAIAQTLDTLLAQVDNIKTRLDAIPNILKTFRQSVLAAAVSGKLTEEWRGENECEKINLDAVKSFWVSQYQAQGKKIPKAKYVESHKLGVIPSSWVNTKIGEVFDVYVGATPSRANKKYWGGNIPWVSSSEVAFCKIRSVKEFITQDGLDNTSTNLHPIGTVMMAMIGQGKTRGQAAILKLEACHNQNTAAMRVPQGFALSEYLYFFLFKQYEETRRAGGGNNQQALNKSSVQSLAFPLPPLKEQTQIVHRVEELFAFADQIERQVKNAQKRVNTLTQSILAKAFRGEFTAQWRAENPDLISGDNSAEALLAKITQERDKLVIKKKPKTIQKKVANK